MSTTNPPSTAPADAKPAAAGGRMALGNVKATGQRGPRRVIVHGPEGVGKTTFGARWPSPIFLPTELGQESVAVAAFPKPLTMGEVYEALKELATGNHGYKTLVVDTLDSLEPLVWAKVCADHGWNDIEAPGYGKGYVAALDEWRIFVLCLERLTQLKGMEVVLLAHSQVRKFANPMGEDFDRYTLKLHDKAAALLREWVGACLFAQYETVTRQVKKGGAAKGTSTGYRIMRTEHNAAWDAKNRWNLPDTMPFDYEAFDACCRAGADPGQRRIALVLKAKETADQIGGAVPQQVAELLSDPKVLESETELLRITNRLAERLQQSQASRPDQPTTTETTT